MSIGFTYVMMEKRFMCTVNVYINKDTGILLNVSSLLHNEHNVVIEHKKHFRSFTIGFVLPHVFKFYMKEHYIPSFLIMGHMMAIWVYSYYRMGMRG